MSDGTSGPVLWRVDERYVAYVTLNRPEVYNAYNGELIGGLHATYDVLGGKNLRAVVIAGSGKNFQAGADVGWLNRGRPSSPPPAWALLRPNLLPWPPVALVQGACFGGGPGIVAACDIVIAADNAIFS